MKTVIVIPALNEAATIDDVVAGVAAHGAPLVVDDGSTDDTAEKAEAAGAEADWLKIRNRPQRKPRQLDAIVRRIGYYRDSQ